MILFFLVLKILMDFISLNYIAVKITMNWCDQKHHFREWNRGHGMKSYSDLMMEIQILLFGNLSEVLRAPQALA